MYRSLGSVATIGNSSATNNYNLPYITNSPTDNTAASQPLWSALGITLIF